VTGEGWQWATEDRNYKKGLTVNGRGLAGCEGVNVAEKQVVVTLYQSDPDGRRPRIASCGDRGGPEDQCLHLPDAEIKLAEVTASLSLFWTGEGWLDQWSQPLADGPRARSMYSHRWTEERPTL
jgi:hypothetical protein